MRLAVSPEHTKASKCWYRMEIAVNDTAYLWFKAGSAEKARQGHRQLASGTPPHNQQLAKKANQDARRRQNMLIKQLQVTLGYPGSSKLQLTVTISHTQAAVGWEPMMYSGKPVATQTQSC